MNRAEDLKELPLPQQLLHWAKVRPDHVALRQKEFGVWRPVTWAEYAQRSRWFGLGLLQLGLQPGQSVAVLGENCKEWVYAEFGAALVGAITAGVYPTSPAEEVEYLLALSEAPIIVCADQEQFDKVLSIRTRLPSLRAIVVINPRGLRRYDRTSFYEFDEVMSTPLEMALDAIAQSPKGPRVGAFFDYDGTLIDASTAFDAAFIVASATSMVSKRHERLRLRKSPDPGTGLLPIIRFAEARYSSVSCTDSGSLARLRRLRPSHVAASPAELGSFARPATSDFMNQASSVIARLTNQWIALLR